MDWTNIQSRADLVEPSGACYWYELRLKKAFVRRQKVMSAGLAVALLALQVVELVPLGVGWVISCAELHISSAGRWRLERYSPSHPSVWRVDPMRLQDLPAIPGQAEPLRQPFYDALLQVWLTLKILRGACTVVDQALLERVDQAYLKECLSTGYL